MTQMYSCQNADNNLKLVCASPYILPTLYVSINAVISLNNIMIICFPLPTGKTLYMHSRVTLTCLHICWHPHQPLLTVLVATHELTHEFHIPISKPVTLFPRYFSAPSYQSLKFIELKYHAKMIYVLIYGRNISNMVFKQKQNYK